MIDADTTEQPTVVRTANPSQRALASIVLAILFVGVPSRAAWLACDVDARLGRTSVASQSFVITVIDCFCFSVTFAVLTVAVLGLFIGLMSAVAIGLEEMVRWAVSTLSVPAEKPKTIVEWWEENELGCAEAKPTAVSATFTLYDDASVHEKLKVMTKWDAMSDDARNDGESFAERIEAMLDLGQRYEITVRSVDDEKRG